MIPVKVNISNIIDSFDLSESQASDLANRVTYHLANVYANNLISLAKTKLHSTRKQFVDGINVIQLSKHKSAVELTGFIANAVTLGASPFDMKAGFMKSAKAKAKKGGGWYITVPFRMATPNTVATSSLFSAVMPPEIYNLAKGLKQGRGLQRTSLPADFDERKMRPAKEVAGTVLPEYQHKSPMFEGVTKTGKGGHSQYGTFRRVSDKSDPASWLHSGFEAKNLHIDAQTMMNVGAEVKMIVDKYLDSVL